MTVEELIEELREMPPTAIVAIDIRGDWELEPVAISYERGWAVIKTAEFDDTETVLLPDARPKGEYEP